MAKQDQILDEGQGKKKSPPPKTSVASDLVNMVIGIAVLVLFITGLILLISYLLN